MKIGIIGGGNMGAAIISSIHKQYPVLLCEKDQRRAAVLRRRYKIPTMDLKPLVSQADVVILAVKPQMMDQVLTEMKGSLAKKKLIVSIAAGLATTYFEKRLGRGVRIVRTMPNMPAQIGEGITAVCKGKYARATDIKTAVGILTHIGETVVVPERLMDAVTAVSGSGPAYVFLFVECMMKAAGALGLGRDLSRKLVERTLTGSSHLLTRQKEEAAKLRAKVTSKGGTTQAALDVFFRHNIHKIFAEALAAAKKRAKELSRK